MRSNQTIRSRRRSLPLPTIEERDAVVGQTFWPKSTGKGLEALARSGWQKTDAIRQAERHEALDASFAPTVVNDTPIDFPLRTPKEQNAVTGDLFYSGSTGKDSGPLARQVKSWETTVKSIGNKFRANFQAPEFLQMKTNDPGAWQAYENRKPSLSDEDLRRAARRGLGRVLIEKERQKLIEDFQKGVNSFPISVGSTMPPYPKSDDAKSGNELRRERLKARTDGLKPQMGMQMVTA